MLHRAIQVRLYVALPLRAMSRLWGWLNDLDLPIWLRRPVLGAYAKVFHCNLSEPIITDITQYRNLGEFFRRRLTPGCRPVNRDHSVVSSSAVWPTVTLLSQLSQSLTLSCLSLSLSVVSVSHSQLSEKRVLPTPLDAGMSAGEPRPQRGERLACLCQLSRFSLSCLSLSLSVV